jgi:hypothetical protein
LKKRAAKLFFQYYQYPAGNNMDQQVEVNKEYQAGVILSLLDGPALFELVCGITRENTASCDRFGRVSRMQPAEEGALFFWQRASDPWILKRRRFA